MHAITSARDCRVLIYDEIGETLYGARSVDSLPGHSNLPRNLKVRMAHQHRED